MTLWASRDAHRPEIIGVQCTYGPITFKVEEQEGHVASFWSELGRVLASNPAHTEARARAGYGRHADRMSAQKEVPFPKWENLDQEERDHWIAVFSG